MWGRAPVEALPEFAAFQKTNVRAQKQAGFSSVIVRLPKGDISPAQFRALAGLCAKFGEGEIRTTNEQNLVLRFIPTWRLGELHRELVAVGLGQAGAMTMADVLSCPGASSCKIAVTNSKAIGAMLTDHLDARPDLVAQVPGLDIKISGCPNGCGQHYSSVIGLQGGMRKSTASRCRSTSSTSAAASPRMARSSGASPARSPRGGCRRRWSVSSRCTAPRSSRGRRRWRSSRRIELAKVTAKLKDLTEMDSTTVKPEDFVDLGDSKAFELVEMEGECAA